MAKPAKAAAKEALPERIGAGEFKAHCLRLLDQVNRTRKPLVITKRGKPVARLVPVVEASPKLYGALKGLMEIKGDIIAPIDVEWDALKRPGRLTARQRTSRFD